MDGRSKMHYTPLSYVNSQNSSTPPEGFLKLPLFYEVANMLFHFSFHKSHKTQPMPLWLLTFNDNLYIPGEYTPYVF